MEAITIAAACVIIGFLLVMIEIFLIPGFGFAGVLGGAFILFGAGLVWYDAGPVAGLAVLGGSGVAAVLLVWGFARSGAARRFILDKRLDAEQTQHAAAAGLLDRVGVAVTNLRPSGSVEIDGDRHDVVTQGEFVDRGAAIRVVEVEGFRVVVEAAADEPEPTKS